MKSSSDERLLDEPLLVGLGERLARDLLGGEHGEVGDLVADLLDRAARLGLDVAARLLHHLLALAPWPRRATSFSCASPVLRARATISSAWPRASASRSRYSSSSCRPRSGTLGGVDRILDRLLALVERLGDARERGFASTYSEMPKTSSVQIISPMPGVTRKLPPSVGREVMTVQSRSALEEEGDQARHEAVEEARLGEREAEPLDRRDLVAHLGLARHGLDDLAEDDADADTGADGAETTADTEGDRLAGVRAGVGLRRRR